MNTSFSARFSRSGLFAAWLGTLIVPLAVLALTAETAMAATTATLPVIAVEQPAGSGLTSGTSVVNFGSTSVGTAVPLTFTIRNTGTADLTGISVRIDGTNSAEFTQTSSPASSVSASGTTTFTVGFNPAAGGTRTATLHIASNDTTHNPFNVTLKGTGQAPVIVVEQPAGTGLTSGSSKVDFGSSLVSTPYSLDFTISNTGSADLTGIAVSIAGTDSADYTVTAPPGSTTLTTGNSTTFTVTFNPSAAGTRTATLQIASNDPAHSTFRVSLTGNGMAAAAPLIVVEQPAGTALTSGSGVVAFGTALVVAGTPKTKTFTIRNTGTADLTGIAVTIDGSNGGDFAVTTAPATTVVARASTTFVVTFTPSAGGTRIANLHVASNDATMNPFNIAVAGVGSTGSATPVISVEQPAGTVLIPEVSMAEFPPTPVGTPVSLTFTINNPGTAALTGVSATVTRREIASTEYAITASPATSVAPGDSTTCTVTFTPLIGGLIVGTLHIKSNDQTHPVFDIYLKGLGLSKDLPVIEVVDATGNELRSGHSVVDFGSELTTGTTGATPYALTFTIKNTGTADLTGVVASVTKDDEISTDFTVSAIPAATVAFGDSTTLTVTFSPTAAGLRTGTLRIHSNSPMHRSFNIYLEGNGMTTAAPLITVDQPAGTGLISGTSKVDFGSALKGSTNMLTFTIGNVGTADLTGLAVTVDGLNSSEFTVTPPTDTTVAARGSTTFMVTFSPAAGGMRSAALHIASNDTTHSPFDIALTGMGTTDGTVPAIAVEQPAGTCLVSGDGIARVFPQVSVFRSSSLTFTVRNTLAARGLSSASNLRITGLTLSGANPGDFKVYLLGDLSVEPGRHKTFKVLFSPLSAGDKQALLTIVSNDPTGSPFTVLLEGNATAVVASVQTPTAPATFSALATGDTSTQLGQSIVDAAPRFVMAKVDGQNWPALSFRRLQASGSLIYVVEESTDMMTWSSVPTPWQQVGNAIDQGDGTERITVLSSDAMAGGAAHCFLRVRVQDGQ